VEKGGLVGWETVGTLVGEGERKEWGAKMFTPGRVHLKKRTSTKAKKLRTRDVFAYWKGMKRKRSAVVRPVLKKNRLPIAGVRLNRGPWWPRKDQKRGGRGKVRGRGGRESWCSLKARDIKACAGIAKHSQGEKRGTFERGLHGHAGISSVS